MIEEAILKYLRNLPTPIEPKKISSDKYKISFDMLIEDTTGKYELEFKIRILKVDEKSVCVEFSRADGNKQKFIEKY